MTGQVSSISQNSRSCLHQRENDEINVGATMSGYHALPVSKKRRSKSIIIIIRHDRITMLAKKFKREMKSSCLKDKIKTVQITRG